MSIKNDIESTYTPKFGEILYEKVMEYKPKLICDIGVLHGFSTYHLARAAKEIGSRVIAVDLFEKYQHNHGTMNEFMQNMEKFNVDDVVEVVQDNWIEWLKKSQKQNIDMVHIDVSNTGDTLLSLIDLLGNKPKVLFEGGNKKRDSQDWMVKYNKPKIIDTLDSNSIKFEVLYSESYVKDGREYSPCLSELFL